MEKIDIKFKAFSSYEVPTYEKRRSGRDAYPSILKRRWSALIL